MKQLSVLAAVALFHSNVFTALKLFSKEVGGGHMQLLQSQKHRATSLPVCKINRGATFPRVQNDLNPIKTLTHTKDKNKIETCEEGAGGEMPSGSVRR